MSGLSRYCIAQSHPGPRARVHRSVAKQRSDFMRLAKIVHPVSGPLKAKKKRRKSRSSFPAGTSNLQQAADLYAGEIDTRGASAL